MIELQLTVEVSDSRQVVLTLPPEVPTGPAHLQVTVASRQPSKKPRTSLAEWSDANAEDWGDQVTSEDVESFTGRSW